MLHNVDFLVVNGPGDSGERPDKNGHQHAGDRQQHRPQIQHGIRIAVLPALCGAKRYLRGEYPTMAAAAAAAGSNPVYVAAAVVVVNSKNIAVEERLLVGRLALLPTARRLRQQAESSNMTVPGAITSDGAVYFKQTTTTNEDR